MLTDLRYTAAEAKEEAKETAAAPMGDSEGSCPWGLSIRLEKRELDKLGITELPQVGGEVHFTAVAYVTQVSQQSGVDQDDSQGVSLQIAMMQVDSIESAAEEAAEKKAGKDTPAAEAAETKPLRARTVMGY